MWGVKWDCSALPLPSLFLETMYGVEQEPFRLAAVFFHHKIFFTNVERRTIISLALLDDCVLCGCLLWFSIYLFIIASGKTGLLDSRLSSFTAYISVGGGSSWLQILYVL